MSDSEKLLDDKLTGEITEPVKVILADDDKEDQELFEAALEKAGIESKLTVVNNGADLVDNLKDPEQPNPDIIFVDINMPVKDGKKAVKEIKEDADLKQIPTVMLSTSDHPKDIVESFEAGADLFIKKPDFFSNFVLILKKVFSLHWAKAIMRPIWQRLFISEKDFLKKDN